MDDCGENRNAQLASSPARIIESGRGQLERSAAAVGNPSGRWQDLLTTQGRSARSFRFRAGAALAVVVALHLLGLALLAIGLLSGSAGAVTVGVVAVAYLRGLVHAFDFDHVSMIDNSTRKFVGEGRDPAGVGLAFSAGHSTVVVLSSVLVIAGVGVIRTALDESSGIARVLGIIGLSVSGGYLLLVAIANLAAFGQAWRLRRELRRNPDLQIEPDDLVPRGPAARIMAAPLRRVQHPRHVYFLGFLFSLGFDTSSQIGLLILTGSAALAGAPAVSLLCLPILFAAAMTLGDTLNGLLMLRMYKAAQSDPARRINYNLVVTGVSILAGLVVALTAAAALLGDSGGIDLPILTAINSLNLEYAGFIMVGLFAIGAALFWLRWRRQRPGPDPVLGVDA